MIKVTVTETDHSCFPLTSDSLTVCRTPNGPVRPPLIRVCNEPEDVDDAMEVPRGTTRAIAESLNEFCDRLGIPPKRRRRRLCKKKNSMKN